MTPSSLTPTHLSLPLCPAGEGSLCPPPLGNGVSPPGAPGIPGLPTELVCPVRPTWRAGIHLLGLESQTDTRERKCSHSKSLGA